MIVATRLSAVWQVAGVAAAALCCYLVSQSVAAQRAGLEKVDRQIAAAHDDIAKLQTEIGVRARQGQLEAWNRDVLALQAPRPSQFVQSGLQLASLYGHRGQPALQLDPAIAAQQGSPTNVAYHPAPAPAPQTAQASALATAEAQAPAPAQPMLRAATFVRPAPSRLGVPAVDTAPTIQKASFEVIKTPARADLDAPKLALAPVAKPVKAADVKADKKAADKAPKLAITVAALKPAPAKPVAKAKVEPVKLAMRDPLPKSLLPSDIGALAAREKSAKAAR